MITSSDYGIIGQLKEQRQALSQELARVEEELAEMAREIAQLKTELAFSAQVLRRAA
jgi:hypothetical protein